MRNKVALNGTTQWQRLIRILNYVIAYTSKQQYDNNKGALSHLRQKLLNGRIDG